MSSVSSLFANSLQNFSTLPPYLFSKFLGASGFPMFSQPGTYTLGAFTVTVGKDANDKFTLDVRQTDPDAASNDTVMVGANNRGQIQLEINGQQVLIGDGSARFSALTVDAGNGDDTLKTANDISKVLDEAGVEMNLIGGHGNDTIRAGNITSQHSYILYGDSTHPWDKYVGGGNDKITGSNGKDWIDAGSGNDYVDARDGDDTIFGRDGNDEIHGGKGNDYIQDGTHSFGRPSIFYAYSSDDIIYGDEGDDTIIDDQGKGKIFGGAGNDKITTYSQFWDRWGYKTSDPSEIVVDGEEGTDIIKVRASNTVSRREYDAGEVQVYEGQPPNFIP